MPPEERRTTFIHKFSSGSPIKILVVVLVAAVVLGVGTGYALAPTTSSNSRIPLIDQTPKSAQQDVKTFKDFAEGKLTKIPEKDIDENSGTHLLVRDGATSVNLTSSVIDLSQYENKKVKVFGSTQSVPGIPWFMDVGRVEELN